MQGFKLVFLTRLTPLLPFPLLNYVRFRQLLAVGLLTALQMFGATKITLQTYLFATILGITPATIMFCYLGSGLKEIKSILAGGGITLAFRRFFTDVAPLQALLAASVGGGTAARSQPRLSCSASSPS